MSAAPITATLGLDQARETGWAIARGRQVLHHGIARTKDERVGVTRLAIEVAGGPLHLLVAFEDHGEMPLTRLTQHDRKTARRTRDGAPERSARSIIGLGKPYGRWEERLDDVDHPERLRIEVTPTTWRRRIHGVISGEVKQAAIDWASRELGVAIANDNQAEAICLAVFASIDGVMMIEHERMERRVKARVRKQRDKQVDMFEGPLAKAKRELGWVP